MRDTPDKRNDQRSGSLKVRDRRKKYQRPCMDAQQETVFRKNLKTISLFLKQFFKVIFYLDRRHYRMSLKSSPLHCRYCKISLTFM